MNKMKYDTIIYVCVCVCVCVLSSIDLEDKGMDFRICMVMFGPQLRIPLIVTFQNEGSDVRRI